MLCLVTGNPYIGISIGCHIDSKLGMSYIRHTNSKEILVLPL